MNISTPANPSLTTPPNSFTTSPLTPPLTEEKQTTEVVQRILEEIRRRREGRKTPAVPWLAFQLEQSEYEDLNRLLQRDQSLQIWVKHKLRYDFFPSTKQFVIRMPSGLHEVVTSKIVEEILRQLRLIASEETTSANFADNVKHEGSAFIDFPDPEYGRHEPDASFRHLSAKYPGVVIEVCYTQKKRDLRRLADDYILGSDGDIRVVVGLDIGYRDKKVTLSIWRPQIQTNDTGGEELVAEQTDLIIRHGDGAPNLDPRVGLSLKLEDFATEALIEKHPNLHGSLRIPSVDIYAYLALAEERETIVSEDKGLSKPLKPGVKKRRRASTPPEQLRLDREARFKDEEHRMSKRAALDDSSYHGGSTSDGYSS